jgi:hypothetical protein
MGIVVVKLFYLDLGETKMRLVNLTPHIVSIETPEGRLMLPSEGLARVSMTTTPDSPVVVENYVGDEKAHQEGYDFDLHTVFFNRPIVYGAVEGLPGPVEGVLYIVSMKTAETLIMQGISRPDVVSPDSDPTAIRENGQIVAVRALNRYV